MDGWTIINHLIICVMDPEAQGKLTDYRKLSDLRNHIGYRGRLGVKVDVVVQLHPHNATKYSNARTATWLGWEGECCSSLRVLGKGTLQPLIVPFTK